MVPEKGAEDYLLVSLGSPRIHSKVSAPSFEEKYAPHLGHRMTEPFDVS